jgi:N-acetylglutamate synthase-like GNAT family acetyltransferase
MTALRLARLAVDERSTGSGIGLALLRAVFVTARRMAEDVRCVGVLVDAKRSGCCVSTASKRTDIVSPD